MTKLTYTELIKQLHTYSPMERVLKDHPEIRGNQKLIKQFNDSLTPEQRKIMMVPLINYDSLQTLLASSFFNKNDPIKVKILKHNRYTTPLTHNHDFYEMFYVVEGEFKQSIGNQIFTMQTGDICLIPPGIYHTLYVDNPSIVLNILIDKETFQEIFLNNIVGNQIFANFFKTDFYTKEITNYIIFRTYGDEKIKHTILKMDLELVNKDKYYAPMVHSLLLQLISLLLRKYEKDAIIPQKSHANKLDLELVEFINNNYQTVTLSMLAKRTNYSEQYISQRLKSATGMSFEKYLLSQRMRESQYLLKYTNSKINEISFSVGYKNTATFIRAFKRFYQMTPSQFRNKLRST